MSKNKNKTSKANPLIFAFNIKDNSILCPSVFYLGNAKLILQQKINESNHVNRALEKYYANILLHAEEIIDKKVNIVHVKSSQYTGNRMPLLYTANEQRLNIILHGER